MLRQSAGALLGLSRPGEESYLYPREGYGQIAQRYYEGAREAGACFRLGARVTAIEREGTRIRAVRYEQSGSEQRIETDCVWSTLPISLLARGIQPAAPPEVLTAAGGLSFRAMIR